MDVKFPCKVCGRELPLRGGLKTPRTKYCCRSCANRGRTVRKISLDERFKKYVDVQQSGCWKWTGSLTKGYGQMSDTYNKGVKRRSILAHRFAYERKYGCVPEGKQLDHLCRNRWCCNPDHLEPVTCKENLNRGHHPNMILKRSGVCKRGHAVNKENMYYRKNGRLGYCRICQNNLIKKRRQLCHDKYPCSRAEFEEGCKAHQDKLFGEKNENSIGLEDSEERGAL
jgi:hypothetical protein